MLKINDWTNEALAAQCVFPKLIAEKYFADDHYRDSILVLVKMGIGGFCIFGGNTQSVLLMTEQLQAQSNIALLFSADFENGLPMRLEDGTSFPHSMALGVSANLKTTQEIASAIALEAKDIGIHWNLAPVADTNSNPRNPIINIRSFGSDFNKVAEQVEAYTVGTQSQKVLACAKHFPGHGDTSEDSHLSLPVLDKSLDDIHYKELYPFRKAIKSGVKSIMTGHLLFKSIDENNPASLSRRIVLDLLRTKLAFKGLIITDALDMKAVSDKYSSGELARKAIEAGNDIALMPQDPFEAIEEIKKAIGSSHELREQIIESVDRIYNAKRFVGLIPGFARLSDKQNTFIKHLNLALRAAVEGTILDTAEGALPIDTSKQYAAFSIVQKDEDMQSASRFFTMLAQATENDCDYGFVDTSISDDDLNELIEGVKDADFLIFAIFSKGRAYQGSLGLGERLLEIIDKLKAGRKSYIVVFGNPYFDIVLPSENIIYTFSDSFPSLASAVMKLAGRELPDDSNMIYPEIPNKIKEN